MNPGRFPVCSFARVGLAGASLLAVVCTPLSSVDAAPPCAPCIGASSAVTGPPNVKLRQISLAPSATADRLRLRGRLPLGAFGAWSGAVDGASVCFSDQNPVGPFLGVNVPMPASGWASSGPVNKFFDPGFPRIKAVTKQTATDIRFKVTVDMGGNVLGSITPALDRPTTAVLYFGPGGSFGCGSFSSVTCAQNIPGTTLNCT